MSERFQYAMASIGNVDLQALGTLLINSVKECIRENAFPHQDPAIRLIGFQIAFASNGDTVTSDYDKLVEYCRLKALNGPNYEYLQKEIDSAETPVPQGS